MTQDPSLRGRTSARARLGSAVRVLLIAIGLSPWLPALCTLMPSLEPLATLLESWFSLQCHRDPSRALTFGSLQLPVCARCFGIYAGLGWGALVLRPRLEPKFLRLWLVSSVVFMLLDVATELLEMRPAWPALRVVTGALLAWPIGVALVESARKYALGSEAEGARGLPRR